MASRQRRERGVAMRERIGVDRPAGAADERTERDGRREPQAEADARLGSSAVAVPITTGSPFWFVATTSISTSP